MTTTDPPTPRLAEDLDTLAAISLEGGDLTPEEVAAIFAHPDVTGDENTDTVWGRVMLTYGQVAALIRIERTGGDALLASLARVEAERDLYASALPYVLRPLSGGGFSVWLVGGTDSHIGALPAGLTTAEVHALAMLAVWARLDADEKRDREYVARVEEERDTARAESARLRTHIAALRDAAQGLLLVALDGRQVDAMHRALAEAPR